MIASATQVKVKGLCGYVRLCVKLRRVKEQIGKSPGLISVRYRGLRALTLWENLESMQRFRNSGAHLDAMRDANSIGKARSFTWEVTELPKWEDVKARLDSKNYDVSQLD